MNFNICLVLRVIFLFIGLAAEHWTSFFCSRCRQLFVPASRLLIEQSPEPAPFHRPLTDLLPPPYSVARLSDLRLRRSGQCFLLAPSSVTEFLPPWTLPWRVVEGDRVNRAVLLLRIEKQCKHVEKQERGTHCRTGKWQPARITRRFLGRLRLAPLDPPQGEVHKSVNHQQDRAGRFGQGFGRQAKLHSYRQRQSETTLQFWLIAARRFVQTRIPLVAEKDRQSYRHVLCRWNQLT